MRLYATIFIILCLVGCRANRNVNRSVQEGSQTESAQSVSRKDSSTVVREFEDTSSRITNEVRYIRTTGYRSDGTIQFVQDEWRGSGSVELASGSGRTSEVSISEQHTNNTHKTITNKLETEQLKSFVDTRLIQGIEWLWVILAVVIVAGIICSIIIYKIRLK